ncbi:MAG: coproporphyrinogen III oxidase [Alphaproteobacteria bacterium]|nr:coproporphyrinogen III oxidase [Alphaproteobacteria bacterium]
MAVSARPDEGLGVYLHWPFCEAVCPYCDFNVRVARNIDQGAWAHGFRRVIERQASDWDGPRPPVASIYFGGGTPSLMAPALVAAIIDSIGRVFRLAPDCEVTLEANPTSAERARFVDFRAAGINRLSLGVQALEDAALRFLGRWHDAAEARAAIATAQKVFARSTFDLIYARPGQSLTSWRRELASALPMAQTGGHVSLYQLSFEEGTPFGRAVAQGDIAPPDTDTQADFYLAAQEACEHAGLPGYEISNHARPGEESRHNLVYWRYGHYLGIGPGAHGRVRRNVGRLATVETADPGAWLKQASSTGEAIAEKTVLDRREQAEELLFMGLRLTPGVARERFAAVTGVPLASALRRDQCHDLITEGLVEIDAPGVRLTARGRPLLNTVYRTIVDRLNC